MDTNLTLRLAHPGMLREHILRESGHEALFVPGYDQIPAGAPVAVVVRFPSEEFRLQGRVMWRRTRRGGAKSHLQTGVGVAWLESQKEAVQRLYAYADAPLMHPSRRQDKRVSPSHAGMRVRYGRVFSMGRDFMRDLSLSGVRIASPEPPGSIGAEVTLYLRQPKALRAIKLAAEIVWIKPGEFGARFLRPSAETKRRLSSLIEAL